MEFLHTVLCGLPGAAALLGAGVYLSFRLRFVQVRRFLPALREAAGCSKDGCGCGEISPMQSLCTALAGTMGTGNIAGIAGAIALGGPGAVFWMWAAAFFGMAVKYAEIALAVRFRCRNRAGEWTGGPMYYIQAGLGEKFRPLAAVFCVCGLLSSLGIGNAAQVNTLTGSLCTMGEAFGWGINEAGLRLAAGSVLALITLAMLLGGVRRIACAAERLIPFVSTVYILSMLCVLFVRAYAVLPALGQIFAGAFSPQAAIGGAAGLTMRHALSAGVTRGVFTHEAGMGSSAMAHAAAHGATPQKQGQWGILEVFIDTMVICTLTALGILSSGCTVPYGQAAGAEVTTQALATVFGSRGSALLVFLCLACYALSTLMAWSFYGLRCVEYLTGQRGKNLYRITFSLLVIPFSLMDAAKMWEMSEIFTVLMAFANVPAVMILCRKKKDGAGYCETFL